MKTFPLIQAPLLALFLIQLSSASPSAGSVPPPRSLRDEVSIILKQNRSGRDFDAALRAIQSRLGVKAVPGLLELARDSKQDEMDRYAAILGTARLGGREAAPLLAGFLTDRSWMVRLASLRALSILKNAQSSEQVLPALQDPALVIRSEAIDAIESLRPSGASEALLRALQDGSNYSGGKAQVIPQKALKALAALQAREAAPRLKPLLQHDRDPQLQTLTIETLERLTGRKLLPGRPLAERLSAWKAERL
jgi:HEAT repeat protein